MAEQFLAKCLGGRAAPFGTALDGSSLILETGADYIPGLSEALANRKPTPWKTRSKPKAPPAPRTIPTAVSPRPSRSTSVTTSVGRAPNANARVFPER